MTDDEKERFERFYDDGDGLIIEYPNKDDKKKHESYDDSSFTAYYNNMKKEENNQ